jgi:hypothetical protein
VCLVFAALHNISAELLSVFALHMKMCQLCPSNSNEKPVRASVYILWPVVCFYRWKYNTIRVLTCSQSVGLLHLQNVDSQSYDETSKLLEVFVSTENFRLFAGVCRRHVGNEANRSQNGAKALAHILLYDREVFLKTFVLDLIEASPENLS